MIATLALILAIQTWGLARYAWIVRAERRELGRI